MTSGIERGRVDRSVWGIIQYAYAYASLCVTLLASGVGLITDYSLLTTLID